MGVYSRPVRDSPVNGRGGPGQSSSPSTATTVLSGRQPQVCIRAGVPGTSEGLPKAAAIKSAPATGPPEIIQEIACPHGQVGVREDQSACAGTTPPPPMRGPGTGTQRSLLLCRRLTGAGIRRAPTTAVIWRRRGRRLRRLGGGVVRRRTWTGVRTAGSVVRRACGALSRLIRTIVLGLHPCLCVRRRLVSFGPARPDLRGLPAALVQKVVELRLRIRELCRHVPAEGSSRTRGWRNGRNGRRSGRRSLVSRRISRSDHAPGEVRTDGERQ